MASTIDAALTFARTNRRKSGSLFIPSEPKQQSTYEWNLNISEKMYFMSRLPRNSLTSNEEGKEGIFGRKKEFLSGLLGEEGNDQSFAEATQTTVSETSTQSSCRQELAPSAEAGSSSRRSSITESLKEFESSLLDMLQDVADEEDDFKPGSGSELGNQTPFFTQPPTREVILAQLKEKNEQDYILTPLVEEEEEDIWNSNALTNNSDVTHKKKDRCKVIVLNQEETKIGFERENKSADNGEEKTQNDLQRETRNEKVAIKEPPIITIETVS